MLIVETTAPEDVIHERLAQRVTNLESGRQTDDRSTADISVYNRMRQSAQPIRRDHITVDTSQDITPAVEQIAAQLRPSLKSATPNSL